MIYDGSFGYHLLDRKGYHTQAHGGDSGCTVSAVISTNPDLRVVGRVHELAKVAAILANDASDLTRIHCREDHAEIAARLAGLRAAHAAATLDALAREGDRPEKLLETATWALDAIATALAQAKSYASTRALRRLAPMSHHQRCLACGRVSLASTNRSAITFRNKHRKTCPAAEFEIVSLGARPA